MFAPQSPVLPTVRLGYRFVPCARPKGSSQPPMFRISVAYASGRNICLPEQFRDIARAEHYLRRFYPELVGKGAPVDISE